MAATCTCERSSARMARYRAAGFFVSSCHSLASATWGLVRSTVFINLAKARQLAKQYRELIATGIDPIEQRNAIYAERRAAEAVQPPPTFDLCAGDYIDLASFRLAQSETRAAMGQHAEDLCIADHRQDAGGRNQRRSCPESFQTDLV